MKNAAVRRRLDELKTKVDEKTVDLVVRSIKLDIASKTGRIKHYEDIHRRLMMIVEERAADATMKGVPGAKSGFIVRQIRAVGSGTNQKIIPEFVADVALVREIRATLEQAAVELNQWKVQDDSRTIDRIEYAWVAPVEEEEKPESPALLLESAADESKNSVQ